MAPTTGATMYIQTLVYMLPDTAEPIVLAGFIEAPEIGPKMTASMVIVDPIANPANSPIARVSVATAEITNINKKVLKNSETKDCIFDPEGIVAPMCTTSPNNKLRANPAQIDAKTWAPM